MSTKEQFAALRRATESQGAQIGNLTSALDAEKEVRVKGEDSLTKTLLGIGVTLSKLNEEIASRGLQQPIPSEKLEGDAFETFRYTCTLALHRATLQNKCLEMSLTVTSGLAVAVVGAALKFMSDKPMNDAPAFFQRIGELPIVIVLAFYLFIQLMLLTNYIYHTIAIESHASVYKMVLEAPHPHVIPAGKNVDFTVWCAKHFQPVILYFSSLLGLILLATAVWHLGAAWYAGPTNAFLPCLIFMAFEFLWLFVLARMHTDSKRVSENWG